MRMTRPEMMNDRQGDQQPPQDSVSRATRVALIAVMIGATLVLYGRGLTQSAGDYGDAIHHLMNGIFVHDALADPAHAMTHPIEYGFRYYRYFPAVNIGYYPPVFPLLSGILMLVFGVSGTTGQLTVLLLAVALTLFSFAWFRLRLETWWAAGATLLLMSTPLLVYWGRDIMLEIPSLAFMTGAVWAFERLLRVDRPGWRDALMWAVLTSAALWTKQTTIILLVIYVVAMVSARRWGHLRQPAVIVAVVIVTAAALALIAVTLALGGANVAQSVGGNLHQTKRFDLQRWLVYLLWLRTLMGWPVLIAAGLGAVVLVARRARSPGWTSTVLGWIVAFYLVHSYFSAREPRYASLWLPPFCALAALGLRALPFALPIPRRGSITRVPVGALLLVGLIAYTVGRTAVVGQHHVSDAYQRAAADLRDRLAPFTCLTFLADRPGRPALSYRLALEERGNRDRDISSFGRIARATQVLPDWHRRWPDVQAMDRALKEWNVKYILTETPRPIEETNDAEIAEAVDGILRLGDFREVGRYPVLQIESDLAFGVGVERFSTRTLSLYERGSSMIFNPVGAVPVRTHRIRVTVPND